jgi:hypothetical protein
MPRHILADPPRPSTDACLYSSVCSGTSSCGDDAVNLLGDGDSPSALGSEALVELGLSLFEVDDWMR